LAAASLEGGLDMARRITRRFSAAIGPGILVLLAGAAVAG
jgi:hypothetical protein